VRGEGHVIWQSCTKLGEGRAGLGWKPEVDMNSRISDSLLENGTTHIDLVGC
jgi:hypothetical protein